MAKTINPAKLLASSKSSAITKIGKSNILAKTSSLSKGLLATRQSKDVTDANNKLIKVDKFLKSDLIVSQKKAEVKRKKKETQDFDEAEKKLETPQSKKFKLPGFNLPSLGFMDRVKRFLFFTALGWLVPKIIEFLPKLEGFAKIVGGIYKFAEGLFGNLFNGFMSLVKFGGDLKDKTLGFIASAKAGVGGNYQKEFEKLEKQFNTFANASIIAGLVGLDMGLAGLDEFNKQRKKGQKPVAGKPGEKPKPSGKPKVTTGKGGEKPSGKPKVTTGKGGKVPGWWNRIFKGPFAKLKGPLSRFAGAAVPGLGAVVGAADAKARFAAGDKIGGALASVSAGLDTITAILALTGVGLPAAAIFGSVSMGIDVILLINDIGKVIKETMPMMGWLPTFKGGGRVVKRYQGGGTTRGGRPVGGPRRRAITPTRRKPPRVTIPKTQPGKDVGGEKKVKEFYAKPEDPNKRYTRPAGGWLANLGKERQDLSAFDTLKKMSGTLKSDETLAKGILGVMSSGIDMALGQKPDKKVFKSFFDSIGYIADTLASQRASKSMSSLRSQIGAFAEGGTIPSRGLRGTYIDANTGDMLAKLIGPTIDQRVNEAIQSIEKQLQMKGAAGPGAGAGPDADPGTGPGAGPDGGGGGGQMPGSAPPEVKAMLEAIAGAEGGWDSVNPSTTVPGLKNMTIAEARLAAIQKGIGEKGGSGAMGKFQQMPDYILERARDSGLDPYKDKFNEENQTKIARMLMASVYPGGEAQLIKDAQKDPLVASSKLRGTWPSLPGGTQENVHTRGFLDRYNRSVEKYRNTKLIVGPGAIKADKIYPLEPRQGRDRTSEPGIDFTYRGGQTLALYPGKVVDIGQQYRKDGGGYGNYVLVESTDPNNGKKFTTLYAHFGDGKIRVNKGDAVQAGAIIGAQPNKNKKGYFTGSGSGEHTSADFYEPDGRTKYKNSNQLITQVLGSFTGKTQGYPTEQSQQQPPGQSPKPRQQATSSQQSIIQALPKKGAIPITVKGQTYYFEAKPDGTYEVWKPGFMGSRQPINISGSKNAPIKKAIQEKINSMYRTGSAQPSSPTKPGPVPAANLLGRPDNIIEELRRKGALQQNMQGGGLVSPSKPNRAIPNSFASYETPGGGMMIAIQPMIIEKPVPVSGGGGKMIAFPVPVAVNSNMDLSLSRG
jgi:hypothetical protein